jgi:hypothetical protein
MRTIVGYLRDHLAGSLRFHAVFLAVMAVAIAANYRFDFEARSVEAIDSEWARAAAYAAFYGVPYFGVLGLTSWLGGRTDFWTRPGFWLTSLGGLVLFSVYASTLAYRDVADALAPPELRSFARKCTFNTLRPLVAAVPLFLVWLARDRALAFEVKGKGVAVAPRRGGAGWTPFLYGFSVMHFRWKPYAAMLAIVAPLIVAASFGEDFIQYYPRFWPTSEPALTGAPGWAYQVAFELCYGVDFVFTELFFRGFLIVGMLRYLGKDAVAPMVGWYAFIHFNKPLLESVGAVCGGFVLGVIACRTLSIYGGVMIHLGVAYLMELAAIGQRIFHNQG